MVRMCLGDVQGCLRTVRAACQRSYPRDIAYLVDGADTPGLPIQWCGLLAAGNQTPTAD